MRIPLVDLQAQHVPLLPALEAAAARVIASGRYVQGEEVAAFEREMALACGVPHAVGVSSGTDALICLLLAAGVKAGHEVLTTTYSFFATAEAIVRVGARPVFADVDPTTFNVDPTDGVARLGPRTGAVLVVHLFGRPARLGGLVPACAAAGIPIIEDAAQAVGARLPDGRPVGAIGIGAGLSFFPAKNLGGFGDGGMVLTADAAVADRVRRLRNHGADRKHHHPEAGGNFRLDELQAALLRVKLPYLAGWTASRRRVAAAYRAQLAHLPLGLPTDDPGCVWHQFVIRVPAGRRDALARHLAERGIETAIHYPIPIHLQPSLAWLGHRAGDFPEAERAAAESLALPIFPELTDEQVAQVASALADFFR